MDLYRLNSPLLAQYLDGLPHQFVTHSSARTKADFSLILRRHLEPYLTQDNLPKNTESMLLAPWRQGDWIPTAVYIALCALARDHLWKTDEIYFRGMFDVGTEMYKGPLYRTMFAMFGPSFVAMGAAKRWDTLHQGTKLAIKSQEKEGITMVLSYPSKLFNEIGVQSLGAAFCAIAEASRGKASAYRLVRFSDLEAEMHIRWTYGS